MKTVKTAKKKEVALFLKDSTANRLAGGFGARAAKQDSEALLRRAVMTCLLWENLFYESGESVALNIKKLISDVSPDVAFEIALEAKHLQKLRHVPLYMAVVMAGLKTHKHLVRDLLFNVIERPDELAEVLGIYWKNKRTPVSAQVKKGLAKAFTKFSEFQFSKYKGARNDIKLKDVMRIVHPTPLTQEQDAVYNKIVTDTLSIPDTWETSLSAGKDKKATWERLIAEKKLGALAFLRNLRNMKTVGVSNNLITDGIKNLNPKWLLPIHFISAAKYAPEYEQELEELMMRMFENQPKLKGYTVFVVDVSGSMTSTVSDKSEMSRMDVAMAMAMIAGNLTEKFTLYATAGSDGSGVHATKRIAPRRGFGMIDAIRKEISSLGGGGIFTRQCLEFIKKDLGDVTPDRIIIFSDSQDCDRINKIPRPFATYNYIVDVSAHAKGVNYESSGWTAEVSGWSENFIPFIMAMEGLSLQGDNEE
jgi:hypothetical protein